MACTRKPLGSQRRALQGVGEAMPAPAPKKEEVVEEEVAHEGAADLKEVDAVPSETSKTRESAIVAQEPHAVEEVAKESASDAGDKASGSDSGDVDQRKITSRDALEEQIQEPPATRVARVWTEYVEKNEKLKDADRLALSSEYRRWSKTAVLDLPEGVAIPPFTEVWLAANRKPAAASSHGRQKWWKKRDGAEDEPPLTSVNAITTRRLKNGEGASSKTPSGCDPLADFAAEANSIYDKDGNPRTRLVTRCDADGEGDEEGGEQSRRRERSGKPAGEVAEITHARCVEMFDSALRSLCEEGFSRDFPVNACVLSDSMRRRFPEYNIRATPFDRFGELVRAAEDEGLIKVRQKGAQLWIDWIKYSYKVVPRDPEEIEPRETAPQSKSKANLRRRSRSRRRPGAHGAGDERSRGGRERERRDRIEHDRGRSDRRDIGRTKGAGDRHPAQKKAALKKRASSEYSYSYEYTDEESYYSASPERKPKQAKQRH